MTFARFEINALTPPLPYADEQFDLVYALSVFTHLPEPLHFAWMREMKRVLKTDGYLIFSTHGEPYLGDLTPDQQAEFRAGRVVVKDQDAAGTNRCGVYVSEEYSAHTWPTDSASWTFCPRARRGIHCRISCSFRNRTWLASVNCRFSYARLYFRSCALTSCAAGD